MEIKNTAGEGHIVIEIVGSLDSTNVSQAEEKIIPFITDKACMVLDMGKCNYVSSAGLRLLLMIAKQLAAKGGWLSLVGVCDEVKDVMEMTGFSCFFKTYNTLPEAFEALKKGGEIKC